MERLADPSISHDEYVNLLEHQIQVLYFSPSTEDRNAAQELLTRIQDLPNAWIRVYKVLDYPSSSINAKFFALQILEKLIRYRWKTLPRTTCESIRNYIVGTVIKLSETAESLNREKVFVSKLNLILVQIVKQEWPANWKSLMAEIVGASRTSVSLCENNMTILGFLSEEVFEFSEGQMTQEKITKLKTQFNDDFSRVFQLCQYVFTSSADLQEKRPQLLVATLKTLEKFLSWIPLGYIFETQLIETLVGFMGVPSLLNFTLPCLVEISSLSGSSLSKYDDRFRLLFVSFVKNLVIILPPSTDISARYEDSDDQTQGFFMDLALFFTEFFREHISLLDVEGSHELQGALRFAHEYLVKISKVPDLEVFKTCLEWWFRLASDLYDNEVNLRGPGDHSLPLPLNSAGNAQSPEMAGISGPATTAGTVPSKSAFYAPILAKVRDVVISRMAKPEEVLIVEDENGEIVRETTKDTASIALYNTMRETLVFLTHLDTNNTERIMICKLSLQMDDTGWSRNNLNKLCSAIGSVSGAMEKEKGRKFLATVINALLQLYEIKRSKENKAFVASNIMYVVGQYTRFLRADWNFLKPVVNKLFEFMHETHPGVQDMACDTFLKISQKCKHQFVSLQPNEDRPFIMEMLETLPEITQNLSSHQIRSFYEACGCIIANVVDNRTQNILIVKLFELPNSSWQDMLYSASYSEDELRQRDKMTKISGILQTNSRVAMSLGSPYLVQLKWIYSDMLKLYQAYSSLIEKAVLNGEKYTARTAEVRNMRTVKLEVLRVLEICISSSEDTDCDLIRTNVVEPLTSHVLVDYCNAVPDVREPAVLSLFSAIVCYMKGSLNDDDVTMIFKSLVGCTLDMIKNNFEEFPDARMNLFLLLRSMNKHNFGALFALDDNPAKAEAEFRIFINAIVWAFKLTELNVAETGLQILLEMIRNVDNSLQNLNYFYRMYFKSILNEIFSVLTDTFHKPGFKLHAEILMHLISAIGSRRITEPIWDQSNPSEAALATGNGTSPPDNTVYLVHHLLKILKEAFPNLTEIQVSEIVKKLVSGTDEKSFKGHLRDFLVQTKEFSVGDNTELFDEEKQM